MLEPETATAEFVSADPVWRRASWLHHLRQSRRVRYVVGAALLAVIVIAILIGPLLVPFDPRQQDLVNRLQPPSLTGPHLFGTDALGRDVLARVLLGGQISLAIGLFAAFLSALVGVTLGLIAGYREGKVGGLIMGLVDANLAFPYVLLAVVCVATLGSSPAVIVLVLVLGCWIQFARPMHALAMSIKHREFMLAATMLGVPKRRIIFQHLLPHIIPTAVVIFIVELVHVILFESALSFLGLGMPPEIPTWGSMMSDSRQYLTNAPWTSVFPGLALVTTVFTLSLLGDWLRDSFDMRR